MVCCWESAGQLQLHLAHININTYLISHSATFWLFVISQQTALLTLTSKSPKNCLFTSNSCTMSSRHAPRMFDSSLMPVRSCLRVNDEIVSNYGPPLGKIITFHINFQVCGELTPIVPFPSPSTPQEITVQPSSVRKFKSQVRVTFSPFHTTIEPNGRWSNTSVATLEKKNEHW